MDAQSPYSQTGKPERPERRACDRLSPGGVSPITLISGRRSFDCRIENLSLSGLQLDFDGEPPALGEIVLTHETAGSLSGQAVWRDKTRIGIRLCEPKSELERALQCLNMITGAS